MNVPVMARALEEAGFSTIVVTMMPYWTEKVGTPRTLAVEHPFGNTVGMPGDRQGQLGVLREALAALESLQEPGGIIHSTSIWPQDTDAATKNWQPVEPSPIIRELRPKFREMLRQQRGK